MGEHFYETEQNCCPKCHSVDICSEDDVSDFGILEIHCHDCGYTWDEKYPFSSTLDDPR